MLPLDRRTIERLARLVVDIGGPYERHGRDLERLLRDAGWANPPEYDTSPRIPWLTEALLEREDDTAAVERFLCRICHPVEYEDGRAAAEAMRNEVNRILEPEQLAVSLIAGQPVLAQLKRDNPELIFTAPPDMDRRLRGMISDEEMVALLLQRAAEAQICEANGAYLLALIGLGSFVEGLLLAVLLEHDQEIRQGGFHIDKRYAVPPDRVGLSDLINTAHAKGWIQFDAKDFVDKVRNYRNFVHPRSQARLGLKPDADTLMMCWAPIRAVLNDLESALTRARIESNLGTP